jgi:GNAT superfamily N-acetyltransferase
VSPRTIALASERPDLVERAAEATEGIWPEYNVHGEVLDRYWHRLHEDLPEFQFVLYDTGTEEILAQGHTVPFAWDGTADGLPAGIDGLFVDAFELRDAGWQPDALSAVAIEIVPAHQGAGLSRTMLEAMARIARDQGLERLVAPVRPTLKERYPLVPIERYAAWTREDGLPYDPWLRVHARLGARILRPEPRSLGIEGTVADWERWVGMPFPESGEYVFPRGLAPLTIDRKADVGRYWEPNVWMEHPL